MKLIIVILASFMLIGCTKKEVIPEEVVLDIKQEGVQVFSESTLNDLIANTNAEIKNLNKELDTSHIGKKEIEIEFSYNKKKYKKTYEYEVIDTEAPVYISAATSRTIKKGEDYYPCNEIVFGDNYDRKPICEIDGVYDLTNVGVYNVEYVIKDSSNNETRKKLTVNVVDEIAPVNNSKKPTNTLPLDNVIQEKKNENTMIGIDVSRWQENIDFESVKNAGVEFVIMRMGINSDIDKDISMDSYFKQNIEGAKNAGLKVGVYVYTAATNVNVAKEHAKWTVDALEGIELDFPVAFDWENWSKFRKYEISIHDLDETLVAFAHELKTHGYDTMLYSSKFYLEHVWKNESKLPVWLAHYTNETNYEGDYFMWQMSNVGRVDGIKGNVDIDILYKNKTSLNLN